MVKSLHPLRHESSAVKFVIESADLHDPDKACALLGVGSATFSRWLKSGKITPCRITVGSGPSRVLIPQSEIDRILNARKADEDV